MQSILSCPATAYYYSCCCTTHVHMWRRRRFRYLQLADSMAALIKAMFGVERR